MSGLGLYVPGGSPLHRAPAGPKLAMLAGGTPVEAVSAYRKLVDG